MRNQPKIKSVLLAEGNETDVSFITEACRKSHVPHDLQIVNNGEAAIQYLEGEGRYSDRKLHPFPDLVFLDVLLPKRTGHEVLSWVRTQPIMSHLPVVMLATTVLTSDVTRAYQLGVNSYLAKVAGLETFPDMVRLILCYWLQLNVPAVGH